MRIAPSDCESCDFRMPDKDDDSSCKHEADLCIATRVWYDELTERHGMATAMGSFCLRLCSGFKARYEQRSLVAATYTESLCRKKNDAIILRKSNVSRTTILPTPPLQQGEYSLDKIE